MESLMRKLTDYAEDGRIPMHMPGHKRNSGVFTVENSYKIDITEIDGFDDYHEPEDIILKSMEHAAEIYGTKKTFYLVNGSSCGIHTALSVAVGRGGKVICARNCHKSVFYAMELRGLEPVYLYPQVIDTLGINGVILTSDVDKAIRENPDAQAVILTSPTYEGILSDIRNIAKKVHKAGMILIVDEAHGAHLPFSKMLPESAINGGADIVIQSLHKTLPCYTQTAVLHICSERVDVDKVQKYLGIYQTSSPSYIFMAGMEQCISYMADEGKAELEDYLARLKLLRAEIAGLSNIYLLDGQRDTKQSVIEEEGISLDVVSQDVISQQDIVQSNNVMGGIYAYDPSKLVIFAGVTPATNGKIANETIYGGFSGPQIAQILREEFNIEPEMVADDYVILMTSLCDKPEWYDVIRAALRSISQRIKADTDAMMQGGITMEDNRYANHNNWAVKKVSTPQAVVRMRPYLAEEAQNEPLQLTQALGRISAEMVYVYPPGIPILMPGEEITKEVLDVLLRHKECGLKLKGMKDKDGEVIQCIK